MNIQILYEDRDLLVCIKPAGLLSQADDSDRPSLVELLQARCGQGASVCPVHRLDQGVGGVMVYGKTRAGAAGLSQAIRSGAFSKEYLAAALGIVEPAAGTWRDYLFKDSRKNKTYVVGRLRKGVKEASLEYETLACCDADLGPLTLVRVKLHTGRTHQIRVQFASRRHPLAGDGKYGAGRWDGEIALWSYRIAFPHPITGQTLAFSQLPSGDPWALFSMPNLE